MAISWYKKCICFRVPHIHVVVWWRTDAREREREEMDSKAGRLIKNFLAAPVLDHFLGWFYTQQKRELSMDANHLIAAINFRFLSRQKTIVFSLSLSHSHSVSCEKGRVATW